MPPGWGESEQAALCPDQEAQYPWTACSRGRALCGLEEQAQAQEESLRKLPCRRGLLRRYRLGLVNKDGKVVHVRQDELAQRAEVPSHPAQQLGQCPTGTFEAKRQSEGDVQRLPHPKSQEQLLPRG